MRGTILKVVPFLIPAIAVVAWAASYQQEGTRIKDLKARICKNQVTIDDSKEAVQIYGRQNSLLTEMTKCLETVQKGLSYRIQVSDLLVELTQTLPDEIFIHEIDLNRTATVERTQQQGTGNIQERLVVERKLKLTLCGFDPVKSDQAVRKYVNSLKHSEILSGIFNDFKPSARQQGTVDRRPATYYEIECILREQG
ncbi:MAG: hypothetical protein ISS71_04555 [Phycisphaerae bacterium]|nr:hypothetical protein [Phycisphaerae bacterium]